MANPEHVDILKQGVEVWNKWRKVNPNVSPNLSRIDPIKASYIRKKPGFLHFIGANFTGVDLSESNLEYALIMGGNLSGANLKSTVLEKSDLRGADLTKAILSGANLKSTVLEESDFRGADLSGANLSNADLTKANLTNASLVGANLQSCYLQETKLAKAKLKGANLKSTVLEESDLTSADFTEAILSGANLEKADLSGANLSMADFTGATLAGADLTRSILAATKLGGADLSGANLSKARLRGVIFANTNITQIKGLNSCYHDGPSIIEHRTIEISSPLPVEFLHGVGLSDYQIEYYKLDQKSLSNSEINDIIYRIYDLRAHQAIQVNPLFISYNHTDNAFIDALEPHFIDKGIRFWRDTHDMKAGRIERQVDRAMRLNPTVLLILSENSVNSDWVEHEAESARELEKQLERDVLCPVALDDSWKDCRWDKRLRRQIEKYNILDFSQWQDEDMFKRQFSRLVDGLDIYYK